MPVSLSRSSSVTRRKALFAVVSLSLILSPLHPVLAAQQAARPESVNSAPPTVSTVTALLLKLRAWFQGGGKLDTLRATLPQAPAAYQQTGSLPAAGYDDPKPSNTSNYDSYLTRLVEPANATGVAGSLPMQATDPTAGSSGVGGWSYNLGSGNYNFTLPVLSLPGRAGTNLSLGLSYNSKVWTRDANTNTMIFNGDRGFPAPGWRMGFGSIQIKDPLNGVYTSGITGKASIIYLAPDGTRHEMGLNSGTGYFETYDSSYLRFDATAQVLHFPNGTKLKFGAYSYDANVRDFQALPIEIKDRNGNFITIAYKDLTVSAGVRKVIDYCIDTAGRRVDFNYQNNLLTSISQNRAGVTFYYLRLDYQPVFIQGRFAGTLTTDPSNIVGTTVYFPVRATYTTGINYRFGYTSFGQINSIQKWVPTISGQGAERSVVSSTFSLPHCVDLNAPLNSQNYCAPVSDLSHFGGRSEIAENWQGGQAQFYQYSYNTPYGHEVTDPTGRRFRVQISGLWHYSAIIPPGGSDSTKTTEVSYATDSGLSYLSNLRVTETRSIAVTNGVPQIRKNTISYLQRDGMWLPETADEYYINFIYRRTITEYTSYPAQYILGFSCVPHVSC